MSYLLDQIFDTQRRFRMRKAHSYKNITSPYICNHTKIIYYYWTLIIGSKHICPTCVCVCVSRKYEMNFPTTTDSSFKYLLFEWIQILLPVSTSAYFHKPTHTFWCGWKTKEHCLLWLYDKEPETRKGQKTSWILRQVFSI